MGWPVAADAVFFPTGSTPPLRAASLGVDQWHLPGSGHTVWERRRGSPGERRQTLGMFSRAGSPGLREGLWQRLEGVQLRGAALSSSGSLALVDGLLHLSWTSGQHHHCSGQRPTLGDLGPRQLEG